MSGEKCSICGMSVRSLAVHLKFNHSKKGSASGGRLSGFQQSPASIPASIPSPLPSITKYQSMLTSPAPAPVWSKKSRKKTTRRGRAKIDDDNEGLDASIAMLASMIDRETAKTFFGIDKIPNEVVKTLFKNGPITLECLELKLKLMGYERVGNQFRRREDVCQDCGRIFNTENKLKSITSKIDVKLYHQIILLVL